MIGICAALMTALKFAMSPLPNIEPISLLIILYTQTFGKKTLYILYVFIIVEGFIYGFSIWWIPYLYVWLILYFAVQLIGDMDSSICWALVSAVFGLLFGTLCVVPTLITLGFSGAFAWIASGFYFDLAHCAGNFFIALLLWKPLSLMFKKAKTQFVF